VTAKRTRLAWSVFNCLLLVAVTSGPDPHEERAYNSWSRMGSFCRAIASDFALCILGENVHDVHAVLYLGDRAECILEADEMGSKGLSLPVNVARGLV
jgi:hypothetical protein